MNKKLFLVAIASLSITFSGLNSLPASAEDIEPRTVPNYDDSIETTSDEEIPTNCLGSDSEIPNNCTELSDQEIEDGTSDEPLVVCADKTNPVANRSLMLPKKRKTTLKLMQLSLCYGP